MELDTTIAIKSICYLIILGLLIFVSCFLVFGKFQCSNCIVGGKSSLMHKAVKASGLAKFSSLDTGNCVMEKMGSVDDASCCPLFKTQNDCAEAYCALAGYPDPETGMSFNPWSVCQDVAESACKQAPTDLNSLCNDPYMVNRK